MRSLAFALTVVLLLASGCGQKGPLYLRDSPPAGIKPPKPEPYRPTPYPESGRESGRSDAQDSEKK